jgi:hypothetical protein
MLEEAGRDATEAFEDVGHSDEARELLGPMFLGDFVGEVCRVLLPFDSRLTAVAIFVLIRKRKRRACRPSLVPLLLTKLRPLVEGASSSPEVFNLELIACGCLVASPTSCLWLCLAPTSPGDSTSHREVNNAMHGAETGQWTAVCVAGEVDCLPRMVYRLVDQSVL